MAKLKKEQKTTTIDVGDIQCTIIFNSTFTDTMVTTIQKKVTISIKEALQSE